MILIWHRTTPHIIPKRAPIRNATACSEQHGHPGMCVHIYECNYINIGPGLLGQDPCIVPQSLIRPYHKLRADIYIYILIAAPRYGCDIVIIRLSLTLLVEFSIRWQEYENGKLGSIVSLKRLLQATAVNNTSPLVTAYRGSVGVSYKQRQSRCSC